MVATVSELGNVSVVKRERYTMPFISIEVAESTAVRDRVAYATAVREGLTAALGPGSRFDLEHPLPGEHSVGGARDGEGVTVQVGLVSAYDADTKSAAVAQVVQRLEAVGVDPESVQVDITDDALGGSLPDLFAAA
jgi:hypothetical protein